jgi:hypothetical protein
MILEPLVHIYNLSFLSGVVPDKLKVAKIVPVFKKGDPSIPGNYKLISSLGVFYKLLEFHTSLVIVLNYVVANMLLKRLITVDIWELLLILI